MKSFFLKHRAFFLLIGAAIGVLVFVYLAWIAPPHTFPAGSVVTILSGTSIASSSEILKEANAIRSPLAFSLLVRLLSPKTGVLANTYLFSEKENVLSVAHRLTRGVTGIEAAKVTIPEGFSVREIAQELKNALPGFDDVAFRALAESHEGYLFPDTYYFIPTVTPLEVVELLQENFKEKTSVLENEVETSGRPLADIITIASLLEREARDEESKRIIAGILWDRIEIGMALQVDAVFGYILGKSGYVPTFADLKIESPYNTYLYPGLPPSPIANPGLESIRAALQPIETDYLYYLTGADGLMYYAKTFEQHKANRAKLR